MPRATAEPIRDGVALDPGGARPLHRQLYHALRRLILSGALPAGARIPSSRRLAEDLGVSRFTVVTALDQLAAEGYLNAVRGSGAYVEEIRRPDPEAPAPERVESPEHGDGLRLSRKARALTWRDSVIKNAGTRYLHMSAPDHRLFPATLWSRLTKEVLARCDASLACYRDSDAPTLLERQIARQVALSRGVACDPEEVVTTLGSHHAVTLLAELLADPGDVVAVEEPGMASIRSVFRSHGCAVCPMPVDQAGADPFAVGRTDVKLAFVTAAKQQPLTIAMPVRRKGEILHWAAENDVIVIEDDLGSEFRYRGRPIPPLKAMDRGGRVIYIGAFSMTLLQTLRLGYMIMPRWLARRCRRLIQVRYRATPQLTEQIVARFIEDGHYARHLHRMRRIYAGRQQRLLQILRNDFADVFEPPDYAAGFYTLCHFRDPAIDEDRILAACRDRALGVEQLSYYYAEPGAGRKALLVGFAASDENEIERGAALLRQAIAV